MGMSSGGNEGLFKLAENAAPAEDRLMPSERLYVKSKKTVSVDEAVALMKQRKKDPSLRIKGGLDDETASIKNARQNIVKKEEPVEQMLPLTNEHVAYTEEDLTIPRYEKLIVKPVKTKKVTTLDLLNAISVVNSKVHSVMNEVDKIQKNLNGVGSSLKNTDGSSSTLSEFKSSTHRVTFVLNGMEFTVKCLNQVKDTDAHTIVFVFSDDGDSFFTPPMQSELEIKYDGVSEPGKVYYFGMCFSLKSLGLKFLGFLYDESSAQ